MLGKRVHRHLIGRFLTSLCSAKGEECIPQTWDMFHEKFVAVLSVCIPTHLIILQMGLHGHLLELCRRPLRTSCPRIGMNSN
jgi:hypothetical protein